MDNREFIVDLEKVVIKKINDTTINFNGMFTINGRTHSISKETTKLENPIETGDEKLTYATFSKEISVEKRKPLILQLYYLEIQNEPHIRIRYKENEESERIKTYILSSPDNEGNYIINLMENKHQNII